LQRTLGNVDRTLKNADATLKHADTSILGPNAPVQQELRDALIEFTRAARSLRVFLDYIERHPGIADSRQARRQERGQMMRRRIVLVALTLAVGLAAGCGTPPPSRFYTLAATATATATPAPSTLVIAVGPVTVPSIVDRPEFVVSTGPNEVRLDDFNRWAAPVQDGLSRAVAENLVTILGTPRVVRFPQTLAEEPDYRVAVEVRTFESTPGKSATLDAVWTVRR
jgi:uncharacterized lipoprotein YmbA